MRMYSAAEPTPALTLAAQSRFLSQAIAVPQTNLVEEGDMDKIATIFVSKLEMLVRLSFVRSRIATITSAYGHLQIP